MWRIAALAALAGTALALVAPGPVVGPRPSPGPGAPDGMLVLAVLAPERAMVADPRSGRATARELPGGTLCHGPLLAAGDRLLVFGVRNGHVVPRLLPLSERGPARALRAADTVLESSTAGRLWVGNWTRQGPRTARIELREVDAGGRVFARVGLVVPRGSMLNAVLDDGSLLLTRGPDLVLRRRGGTPRLFRGGWLLATAGDRFAWQRERSQLVRVWSHAGERVLEPPPGLRPEAGPEGAFSPRRQAARAGRRDARPLPCRRDRSRARRVAAGSRRQGVRLHGDRLVAVRPLALLQPRRPRVGLARRRRARGPAPGPHRWDRDVDRWYRY
jgi:hypothetical protein